MNVVIIDDDKTAISALMNELACYPEVNVVGTATSAKAGFVMIKLQKIDLIFLDVELPDLSGITLMESIQAQFGTSCKIVIYSSYDKYMLRAFRKNAFDYLVKPIDRQNLETIMHRYHVDRQQGDTKEVVPSAEEKQNQFMLYLNSTDFVLTRAEDIGIFSYNHKRKIWEAVVVNKLKPIPLKHSVTSELILSLSNRFVQVHQSYIINLDYLIGITDNMCKFYPPFDNVDYVTVGRIFKKKLTDKFFSL
jgi:two-component system LytT family response regulator